MPNGHLVSEKSPAAAAAALPPTLRTFALVPLRLVGAARGNRWNLQLFIHRRRKYV